MQWALKAGRALAVGSRNGRGKAETGRFAGSQEGEAGSGLAGLLGVKSF